MRSLRGKSVDEINSTGWISRLDDLIRCEEAPCKVHAFVGSGVGGVNDHKPRAKQMAFFTSSILSGGSFVMKAPILLFETV